MHLVAIDADHAVAFHESGIGGGAVRADVANDRRAGRIDADLTQPAALVPVTFFSFKARAQLERFCFARALDGEGDLLAAAEDDALAD